MSYYTADPCHKDCGYIEFGQQTIYVKLIRVETGDNFLRAYPRNFNIYDCKSFGDFPLRQLWPVPCFPAPFVCKNKNCRDQSCPTHFITRRVYDSDIENAKDKSVLEETLKFLESSKRNSALVCFRKN